MEDADFSYVNQSFVADTIERLRETDCDYGNTSGSNLPSSISVEEDNVNEKCNNSVIENNGNVSDNVLDEEIPESDSSEGSDHSYNYPDITPELISGKLHRSCSCTDVEGNQYYSLPNMNNMPRKKSNRSSLCSVHSYIDLEELTGASKGRSTKGSKRRTGRKSKKYNPQIICSGITSVGEDKIVIVTKTGDILVFGNSGKLIYLTEFMEAFEDVTTLSKNEVAASCGFCIKVFRVEENKIEEIEEKCIDYQYSGEMTVHAIHFVPKKFVISCNLQSCIQHNPFIRIINMKGQTLKSFEIPKIISPGHLCTSDDGHLIFLTDQVQKKVIALESTGSIKWEISTDRVPQYVTLCEKKTVVVSFERDSELTCFTTSGKLLPPLETRLGPLSAPFPVCCAAMTDTVYFCCEVHNHFDREFVHSTRIKKSKMQKITKLFKK